MKSAELTKVPLLKFNTQKFKVSMKTDSVSEFTEFVGVLFIVGKIPILATIKNLQSCKYIYANCTFG